MTAVGAVTGRDHLADRVSGLLDAVQMDAAVAIQQPGGEERDARLRCVLWMLASISTFVQVPNGRLSTVERLEITS